ncbi:hypothetical protein GYMLUDRAFT_697167 [Collybiopsis luxurians FD-317 M1]|uniref:Uncharacterized protein n=1 Tax=Collybiopsis luxurians FD-317 M1 TaxID=944289 RepID=A0A0D0CS50_9AGAR|nr:hypothetical protein GYMLUDRAFT_697167 [Collybiopsis luxurians FD-317 M1]
MSPANPSPPRTLPILRHHLLFTYLNINLKVKIALPYAHFVLLLLLPLPFPLPPFRLTYNVQCT